MLDTLAPLTMVIDSDNRGQTPSKQETMEAIHSVVSLLGNANTRLSRLRREVILEVNKALLPIVQAMETSRRHLLRGLCKEIQRTRRASQGTTIIPD